MGATWGATVHRPILVGKYEHLNNLYIRNKEMEEGQPKAAEDNTGSRSTELEGISVFAKTPKIARTPPQMSRYRKNSCPEMKIMLTKPTREDLHEDNGSGNNEKRKRPEEESPPTEIEDRAKNSKGKQSGGNRIVKRAKEGGQEEKHNGGNGSGRNLNTTDNIIKKLDLDITATEEEVKSAILEKIGSHDAPVTVKSLRLAYGKTKSANVELPKEIGEDLISEGKIRIGWALCKIRRTEILRCTKCWMIRHRRRDCQGPDRTALCLKCAREGHKVKDCPNDPSCPICGKDGHRADSIECPIYGEKLKKEIRKGQETTKHMNNQAIEERKEQEHSSGQREDTWHGGRESPSYTT